MTNTQPTWRCGHLCLIDVPESYRGLRLCPECRERRYPYIGMETYVRVKRPGRFRSPRRER